MGFLRVQGKNRMSSQPVRESIYADLNGGLNERSTDFTKSQSPEAGLQLSDTRNSDFFSIEGIAKRNGKAKRGADVGTPASVASQTTEDLTRDTGSPTGGAVLLIAFKFTASSTTTIAQATMKIITNIQGLFSDYRYRIMSDVAGVPTTGLGTTQSFPDPDSLSAVSPVTLNFSSPVSVTSATTYWLVLQAQSVAGTSSTPAAIGTRRDSGSTTASDVQYSLNNGATWANDGAVGRGYFDVIHTGSAPIQGLYDYQVDDGAGGFTQKLISVSGDGTDAKIYQLSGPVTDATGAWTSIKTVAGAHGQNKLFDFATQNKYLFVSDSATVANQCWDGSNAATMTHGYRPTVVATTPTTTAGTGTWTSANNVKIMLITALKSGGFRASAPITVAIANTGHYIDVTGTGGINSTASQYSFDVGVLATKVFATKPGGEVYYKVKSSRLTNFIGSSTQNPLANDETGFRIQGDLDAAIEAENSIAQEFTKTQAYMTGQNDMPKSRFLQTGSNFLFLAGDPLNQSRVWIMSSAEPQICGIGTSSGADGTFVEVGKDDGESITGIFWADGYLFAHKSHSIHRIEYNSSSNTWSQRLINPDFGALSHWSIQKTQIGITFVSEKGFALHDSTAARVFLAERIGNKFDPSNSTRFNLASMQYLTSAHYTTKRQIIWSVSSTSATIRDLVMIYNYETDTLSLHDGVTANYFARISDANKFIEYWSGDYSGRVFKHDTGTNDGGAAIAWYADTPNMSLTDAYGFKRLKYLVVSGTVQSAGTLYCDVFLDKSATLNYRVTFDMSDANFKNGLRVPLRGVCKFVKFKFKNSNVDVPVFIDGFELHYQMLGSRL